MRHSSFDREICYSAILFVVLAAYLFAEIRVGFISKLLGWEDNLFVKGIYWPGLLIIANVATYIVIFD